MLNNILSALFLVNLAACNSSSTDSGESGSAADSANPGSFYRDKNLTYIVSTYAGGGYDTYARLITKHMGDEFEVKNIIISNIPGAGHIIGTNILYKAKPDGLTIGTFNAGLIYNQLAGRSTIQFKTEDFEWIGKAAGEPRSLIVSEHCDIQSMEELLAVTEPVIFASSGVGTAGYSDLYLLKEALGLNIKVIPGFDGTKGDMAMMRGEVCAQLGTTSSYQPLVDAGYGSFILTVGGEIEGVPNALEYATTPRARKIIELIDTMAKLGRITAAPPGTLPERLKVLQDAYGSALANPNLLTEAENIGLPIEYMHGDDVKKMIANALDQEPEVIELITKILKVEGE